MFPVLSVVIYNRVRPCYAEFRHGQWRLLVPCGPGHVLAGLNWRDLHLPEGYEVQSSVCLRPIAPVPGFLDEFLGLCNVPALIHLPRLSGLGPEAVRVFNPVIDFIVWHIGCVHVVTNAALFDVAALTANIHTKISAVFPHFRISPAATIFSAVEALSVFIRVPVMEQDGAIRLYSWGFEGPALVALRAFSLLSAMSCVGCGEALLPVLGELVKRFPPITSPVE